MKILGHFTDSAADAIWPYLMTFNPNEILAARERMKMELARYGKQSLLQWDNIEVPVIRRWHEILAEVVAKEHPSAGVTED